MNKKFLLFGAVAVAGFLTLTAFGGKTLAEQQAEITKMVTEKLDAYKVDLQAACDERVAAESQTRFDQIMADKAAAEAAKPVPGKKAIAKKPVAKGPKVDPLPQGSKQPTDPQKTRGGAVQEGNVEKQKERSGAAPVTPSGQVAPEVQKKRGGAAKEGGGNK
jgi:hypothetical protein